MMRHPLHTISSMFCVTLGAGVLFPVVSLASAVPTAASAGAVVSASALNMTELSHKWASSWPWYLSRSSGLIAAVLLLLLGLSGIGQLTGFSYRFMEPLMSWSLHRALAIAFGITVCIHGLSLLLDKYEPFNIFQIIIPFIYHYPSIHNGTLYLSLGIIASYLVAILIFTSLYWINTKQKPWRLLHYVSYVLVILVFLHGLFLGVDTAHGPLRLLWWFAGVLLIIGIGSRLLRAGTIHQAKKK